MTSISASQRVTALVTAVLLTTGIAGCSESQGGTPAGATGASSASPVGSSSSSPGAASGSAAAANDGTEVLPAALFEEGGMTLVEYTRQHPDADYLDLKKESVLEEKVGKGQQQITVDAQEGARLRAVLVCPSDATGKTEIRTSRGTEGKKSWMAGSDALCGGWSATTPPVDHAGPMTFTATVDNDEPFRMVLTVLSE